MLKDLSPDERRKYARDVMRRWRSKNRELVNLRAREWRKQNPSLHAKYQKGWQDKNLERVRAYRRAQYQKHKKKILARNAEYQRANKDKCSVWRKRSHRLHPETAINSKAKRKRLVGNQRLSRGLTKRLLFSQNGRCALCPAELSVTGIHHDHIVPLSRGGKHEDANIQLTCPACNLSKHAKILK